MRPLPPVALLACTFLAAPAALAQLPRILPRGVVNAASFARPGLPNGRIARGSIFSVFGTNIGPASPADLSNATFPLSSSLSGVSLTITQGDTTLDAIPVFAHSGQVNAIMPSDAPLGPLTLRITNGPRQSNPVTVEVVESSLGIFSATGIGAGPGIVQNFISQAIQPINSLDSAAQPEQLVTIWATGLGPVDFPDNDAPLPETLDIEVAVWVGGVPVPAEDILYAGRSPCCAGVDQIIIRLPATVPTGCYVPLHIRTAGEIVSNTVTMAIDADPSGCGPQGVAQAPNMHRSGQLWLLNTDIVDGVDSPASNAYSVELAVARFRERAGGLFRFDALDALPPAGACTVYQWRGSSLEGFPLASGTPLSAGDVLRVQGPRGSMIAEQPALETFEHYRILGGGTDGFIGDVADLLGLSYLQPGEYSVSSEGGADVEAFEATVQAPQTFEWTNRDQINIIDRSTALTLDFNASSADFIIAAGGASDSASDSFAAFVCTVAPEADSLTVAPRILSQLPASSPTPNHSNSWIYLGAVTDSDFPAPGLNEGTARAAFGAAKSVILE